MGNLLKEGELEFDFRSAIKAEHFDDETSHGMSHCMKAVDFLVEWPDSLWLVEVKDPSMRSIPDHEKERQKDIFIDKLERTVLFSQELGPKVKDSFLYLYLGDLLPDKPLSCFVLLALESLTPRDLTFSSKQLRKSSCLLGPSHSIWQNQYIEHAFVFNLKSWNNHLPQCPVRRV